MTLGFSWLCHAVLTVASKSTDIIAALLPSRIPLLSHLPETRQFNLSKAVHLSAPNYICGLSCQQTEGYRNNAIPPTTSQSLSFRSEPPVAKSLPEGLHRTQFTSPSWASCQEMGPESFEKARFSHNDLLFHKYLHICVIPWMEWWHESKQPVKNQLRRFCIANKNTYLL